MEKDKLDKILVSCPPGCHIRLKGFNENGEFHFEIERDYENQVRISHNPIEGRIGGIDRSKSSQLIIKNTRTSEKE